MPYAMPFEKIAARAASLGASLAGAVPLKTLLASPSHHGYLLERRLRESATVIVLALAHAPERPKLDWWDNRRGHTPGNRLLIKINRSLTKWLAETCAVGAFDLTYEPTGLGIYLKDAAVLAGLGVMGRSNLVITPRFGPRIRLRGLLVDLALPGTGPLGGFAPCDGCGAPCRRACPREAFQSGAYQRERCQMQMTADEADKIALAPPVPGMPVRYKIGYCRGCELSCPVGR